MLLKYEISDDTITDEDKRAMASLAFTLFKLEGGLPAQYQTINLTCANSHHSHVDTCPLGAGQFLDEM